MSYLDVVVPEHVEEVAGAVPGAVVEGQVHLGKSIGISLILILDQISWSPNNFIKIKIT